MPDEVPFLRLFVVSHPRSIVVPSLLNSTTENRVPRMQKTLSKIVILLRDPISSSQFATFHSTHIFSAKWKNKWDHQRGEGISQKPSKNYTRYIVRQKRAEAKKALKDYLLHGKSRVMRHQVDSRKQFYSDEYHGRPDTVLKASFGLHECFTWSFTTWDSQHTAWSTRVSYSRDESTDDSSNESSRERIRRRTWRDNSFDENDGFYKPSHAHQVGSYTQRTILGLPATGPINLNDVKSAFRLSALKWHPDKHQGPSQTFIRIVRGRHPLTIFTDQDQAMVRAIENIMPHTRHQLCQWHITKKIPSKVHCFTTDKEVRGLLFKCMSKYDLEEEFEQAWTEMISKESLEGHQWLTELYKIRRNMSILSTQHSKSTNNVCHDMSKATSSITDYFLGLEKIITT